MCFEDKDIIYLCPLICFTQCKLLINSRKNDLVKVETNTTLIVGDARAHKNTHVHVST